MATLSPGTLAAALLPALLLFFPPLFGDHASAQQRPLTFVVGAGAQSVFDRYTRTLAAHVGRHLPDRPDAAVRNMVGGGGSVAADYLYRKAEPDGRTVGNWPGALVLDQIFGSREVPFDTRRFAWVGALSTLHPVCVLTRASGADDLTAWAGAKRPLKLGGVGRNDVAANMPRVFAAALGLPVKLIDGYEGPVKVRLAAHGQELDGGCGYWRAVEDAWRKMLAAGDARVVLQAMTEPHPDLPSAPNALDLAKSEDARLLIVHGVHDPAAIARAYSLPPGTPDETVAVLRKAFADTAADPSFLAEARKERLDVRWVGGAEIAGRVKGLFDLSPAFIVKLRKVLFPEAPAGGRGTSR